MAQQLMPGASLWTITGKVINATTGEYDPANNQSSWKFGFLDLGNGQVLYLFYTLGMMHIDGPRPMNTETAKVITVDWDDSSDIITKLTANGFVAPTDPNTTTNMNLAMFIAIDPMDPRASIADPFWNVTNLNAPPGMTPTAEDWWIAHVIDMSNFFLCNPMGQCSSVP
jgi:hypothetical protein